MEKRQAVEFLEYLLRDKNIERTIYEDALKIAIESLKTQLSQEGTTSDTISRQATLEKVRAMQTYKLFMGDDMILVDKAEVQTELMMLPPVQSEPQEGHWIRTDCGLDVECKCSVCGYKDFVEPHDTYWFKRNYCPNCGAKMKGERQK